MENAVVLASLALLVLTPSVAWAQDGQPESSVGAPVRSDLRLADAIRMAHAASPSVRAASAEVERADAETRKAVSGYLPRVTATAGAGGQLLRDTLPPIRQPFTLEPYGIRAGSVDARADLRWTLWDFGRTSAAVASAGFQHDAQVHGADAARAEVTRLTATLFVSVIFDAQIVESKQTSVRHRARHAALTKALVEKGVRAPIDEVRARLAVESARQDLTTAEGRLRMDRERLASALGVEPDAIGHLTRPTLPAIDETARAAAVRAARSRPEALAAAATARAREASADAARSQLLPSIGATVTGAYRLTRYLDVPEDAVPRAEASGQITVTIPVFDYHAIAAVSEARASAAARAQVATETTRQAKLQASIAALELENARARDARARELASATRAALGVVEARYQSGLAGPLELVDAETSDVEAREALLDAEVRQQIAAIDLAIATGRASALESR